LSLTVPPGLLQLSWREPPVPLVPRYTGGYCLSPFQGWWKPFATVPFCSPITTSRATLPLSFIDRPEL